jgi:hypothetical protein
MTTTMMDYNRECQWILTLRVNEKSLQELERHDPLFLMNFRETSSIRLLAKRATKK